MTENNKVFAELDDGVVSSVKFDDRSMVEISGHDRALFRCHNGENRGLTDIYFIPRLWSNIVDIGQPDERGCHVLIDNGVLRIRERERRLLIKVNSFNN